MARLSNAPEFENTQFIPLFTNFCTSLGSSLFLWWKLFMTGIYPGIPELGAVAYAFENSFALFQVFCQSSGLKSLSSGARLHAMSHIGVLAASQASTSPNKICQADKKLISLLHSFFRHSSSPGCGRNAELGLELVSAQVRNELPVWNVALSLHPCFAGRPQVFASRFLVWELFGVESALMFTSWSKGALN